jgi:hypothetical protein
MAPKKPCACNANKSFIVTPATGSKFTVKTETEARTAARRTKGTYKLKS